MTTSSGLSTEIINYFMHRGATVCKRDYEWLELKIENYGTDRVNSFSDCPDAFGVIPSLKYTPNKK